MTDQELSDLSTLLRMCRREKAWPGPRAVIEEIEARHAAELEAFYARRLTAAGWKQDGQGWTKAA